MPIRQAATFAHHRPFCSPLSTPNTFVNKSSPSLQLDPQKDQRKDSIFHLYPNATRPVPIHKSLIVDRCNPSKPENGFFPPENSLAAFMGNEQTKKPMVKRKCAWYDASRRKKLGKTRHCLSIPWASRIWPSENGKFASGARLLGTKLFRAE